MNNDSSQSSVNQSNLTQEIMVFAWFAVVLLSFFAPTVLPPNVGTALYGLFLVLGIAALTLRFLRRDGSVATSEATDSGSTATTEPKASENKTTRAAAATTTPRAQTAKRRR